MGKSVYRKVLNSKLCATDKLYICLKGLQKAFKLLKRSKY